MKGVIDFYSSYLYKSKGSKIMNLFLFYFIVFILIFYCIYYANLFQVWFNHRLNNYSDFFFFYVINCIFYIYEVLFKGITIYSTYFASMSTARMDSGLIVVDQIRAIFGSMYKNEDNTFLQRAFPKPHFTLLSYIFYFSCCANYYSAKLFVKKKSMYFFLS